MRVLGKKIVVEQVMTKKQSKIIRLDKENKEQFEVSMKVVQLGPECPVDETSVKVGEIPIISPFAQVYGAKVLEKSDERMSSHIIYDYDDVVGIDDEPTKEVE